MHAFRDVGKFLKHYLWQEEEEKGREEEGGMEKGKEEEEHRSSRQEGPRAAVWVSCAWVS